MGLQCLISYFSSSSLFNNFHTPIPSRKGYSKFKWSINLLVLRVRQIINLRKKTLKLLLEIQNNLKSFYHSNDPESVMVIDSINTVEELEEMEENLKDRDYRKRLVSPISLYILYRVNSPASTRFCLFISLYVLCELKSFELIIVLNAFIFQRNCWRFLADFMSR